MLISKINPQGIDIPIQRLQMQLHSALQKAWGVSGDYACYGRAYRNRKSDGFVAEIFDGAPDYKEVYWDDNLKALSFFGISPVQNHDIEDTVNVHLVFFCNVQALKPSVPHYADEEVRLDVVRAVGRGLHGFSYEGLEIYLENVLKEYPGSRRDDRLKTVEMYPITCFRLNYTLRYNQKQIC